MARVTGTGSEKERRGRTSGREGEENEEKEGEEGGRTEKGVTGAVAFIYFPCRHESHLKEPNLTRSRRVR